AAREHVLALEADGALHGCRRRQAPHDGHRQRRLAAARFTTEAEDLALAHLERHVLHGRHRPEVDRDAVEREERPAHRLTPCGSKCARIPSPIRMKASTAIAMARPGKMSAHGACCSTW